MSATRQAGRRRPSAGGEAGTVVRDVVGRRVRMAAGLLVLAEFVVFVLVVLFRAVRIIPQASAGVVERLVAGAGGA